MPENITLSNGMQIKVKDGLSDEEIVSIARQADPATSKHFEDIEDNFDIQTGVKDADLRFSLALADQNPKEVKLVMDEKVGEGNWGYSPQNYLYVTPKGMQRRGIEAGKNTLVNGLDVTRYDFVDAVPEITVGLGALGAELLLPMIPGSGVIAKGALSGLVSRGLLASSARAGAGDMAANIALEEVQKSRGENVESAGEIITKAGAEGAMVFGISSALGLPFKLMGGLGGKVAEVAKNRMGPVTSKGLKVDATSAEVARNDAIALLKENGYSQADIDTFVPAITLRHLIGDEGNLVTKFSTVLEGLGAKQLGDKLPADGLMFLSKIDDIVRAGENRGLSTVEIVEQMKNSLSKKEVDLLRKTSSEIDGFYKNVGAKAEIARDVSFLTGLVGQNIKSQYRYGASKFNQLYDELDLDGLTAYSVSPTQVADLVNDIARNTKGTVTEVLDDIAKANSSIATKLEKVVKVSETRVVPVPKLKKPEKQAEFESANTVNAKDLLDLSRSLRRRMSAQGVDPNVMRKSVLADGTLMDRMDSIVGKNFGNKLAEVNAGYKQFISPYKKSFKNLSSTSAQTPEAYVKDLMTGRKSALFTDLIDQLDDVFKGTEAIGGRAKYGPAGSVFDTIDTNTLLAKIGTQYMRWTKDRFNLGNPNLTIENLPLIRKDAKDALKMLDDLENKAENTVKYKKAFKKVFNNEGFNDYKKALKQVADGNPEGLGKLQQALSYKEAEQFIGRVSQLGDNLSGSGKLAESLAEFRAYKAIDPKSASFYNELLYTQVYSRLLKIGGLDAAAKNGAMKNWAEDIVTANNMNKEALEELLGEFYEPMMMMGNTIQGAFNIDATAGAISVSNIPLSSLRAALNMSVVGTLKPLSLMYTMKTFAPGKPGWQKLKALADKGVPQDKIESAMRPYMKKTLEAAKKANNLKMAGRNGLLAASISAYMDEADENLPQENEPIVRKEEVNLQQEEQAAAPDQAVAQQELGQNMMALLQSAQSAGPQAGVQAAPMQQPARGVPNAPIAPQAPAVPLSINASSIPNSFANLMGSINLSGRG